MGHRFLLHTGVPTRCIRVAIENGIGLMVSSITQITHSCLIIICLIGLMIAPYNYHSWYYFFCSMSIDNGRDFGELPNKHSGFAVLVSVGMAFIHLMAILALTAS